VTSLEEHNRALLSNAQDWNTYGDSAESELARLRPMEVENARLLPMESEILAVKSENSLLRLKVWSNKRGRESSNDGGDTGNAM
jgi:hypothetical protein